MKKIILKIWLSCLIGIAYPIAAQEFQTMAELPFQNFEIAKQLIKNSYSSPQVSEADLEVGAINGMLAKLNDPYSRYLTADQVEKFKKRQDGGTKAVTIATVYNGVGYIRLASFEPSSTTKEVRDAITMLMERSIRALVIDLRDNGGGQYEEAFGVLGLLVQKVDVAYTVYRNGEKMPRGVTGPALYSGPLLIMVNKKTASSSEVVAGAIQDLGRGRILGEKTLGKASVQRLFSFPDGAGLLLTVAHYLTPKGRSISNGGIVPDDLIYPLPNIKRDTVLEQVIQKGIAEGYRRKY